MAIREIEKNKYCIEVVIGYNGNKKIRHYETFIGGIKEARLRENQLKIELKNNTYIKKKKITVEELINEWLKYKKPNLALKTYKAYELYSKNIIKCLGHIHIKDLNAKILEDFYNELKTNSTFADRTIKSHYQIMSNALNCAVKWEYLYTNPNSNVEPIKIRKKEIHCYNPEEVTTLVTHLQSEPIKYQAVILLALDSGIRRGELTGLTWSDIDFDKCIMNINKTTQYVARIWNI
jgi:Site-specific recombinase XerD